VDVRTPSDERRYSRTAKSCGPGAPEIWRSSSSEAEKLRESDGGKRDGSPRRARISRNTIAQGRPVVTACTCGFRARAIHFCAGAPGAAATRPSLRPLFLKRVRIDAKLGRIPSREGRGVSSSLSWPILRDAVFAAPQDEVVRRGNVLRPSW
jgi:hypothetical protein